MNKNLKWNNQTMRCQILSIDFLILFIITGAVTLISYFNIRLVVPSLQQSSEELYLKVSSNLINSNLYQYEQIILRILSMNGNQLITLNQLYTKAHDLVKSQSEITLNDNVNMNYLGTNPFPSILETEEGFEGKKTSNSFICYTNLTTLPDPLTQDFLIEIKVQEYMQALGQIIYQGNLTKQFFFYGATERTDFNIIYPCLHRAETIYSYKPKTRNWYQDAKELYESTNLTDLTSYQFKITKPYLLYTAQFVGQSIYIPMINKEKEFIGAWATNIYSQEMSKFVKNNNFLKMALLLDEDGTLVVHDFPNVTLDDLPLYIYQEDKTGFNEQDWKYMKKMDKQSQESTCTSFNKQYKELLCAYNSYYKEEVLIGIVYLKSYNLFLIILYDTKQFFTFQEERELIIQDTYQNYITLMLEIYSISAIIGTIVVIIAIIILTRPIKLIINSIKSKVNNGVFHLQDLSVFDMFVDSPEIQNLYLSYAALLIKFSDIVPHNKNKLCSEIEQIQEYEALIYYYNFEQYIHDQRCIIKLFDSHSFCKRFQEEEQMKAFEIIKKANAQLMSNKKPN